MSNHAKLASNFTKDINRTKWHDKALWFVRQKRDIMSKSIPEWEELRNLASQIKTHTLSNLDVYLEEFEKNAKANGAIVHYAKDANEHNKIMLSILNLSNVKKVVKSKSMLTEECGLNSFLEQNNIEVIDTDLGERIIQLRKEHPSHIVLPAIHLKKEDVGNTFFKFLNTQEGNCDPSYLTNAAREHLREHFLSADAAITGVNFAIAQTGAIVVCTNEGNADLGASLPKLHIASMGIEKIIPKLNDLGVFTRLLARSATGQPITTYTSVYHKPENNNQLHIIIVDNNRSNMLKPNFFPALKCIRCGACMNTCPVFRRSGGHSYSYIIPGPIGSTLGCLNDIKTHSSMVYACSLCGSCSNVCPCKINIHEQIYLHRQEAVDKKLISNTKIKALKFATFLMKHPKLFELAGFSARIALRILPRFIVYSKINIWGKSRDLPTPPKKTFKDYYRKNYEK